VLLIAALLLGISGSAVLRYVAASFFVVAYVRVDLAVQVGDAERVSLVGVLLDDRVRRVFTAFAVAVAA